MYFDLCVTPDGWETIRNNLAAMSTNQLISALIENSTNEHRKSTMKKFSKLPPDLLIELCYSYVEKHRTCYLRNNKWVACIDKNGYYTVPM